MGNHWVQRNRELQEIIAKQPYDFTYGGISIVVAKNVFPPDAGYTTLILAEALQEMRPSKALDMGTGSLLLALVMRKAGVPIVWAADNHPPAIACSRENLERNADLGPIHIIQSNLFSAIPSAEVFELIIFNQPYYPIRGLEIAGMGADGGREIICRFFKEAVSHLAAGGQILMPYSSIAGDVNNPVGISETLGWEAKTLLMQEREGIGHGVYSFRPKVVSTESVEISKDTASEDEQNRYGSFPGR